MYNGTEPVHNATGLRPNQKRDCSGILSQSISAATGFAPFVFNSASHVNLKLTSLCFADLILSHQLLVGPTGALINSDIWTWDSEIIVRGAINSYSLEFLSKSELWTSIRFVGYLYALCVRNMPVVNILSRQ